MLACQEDAACGGSAGAVAQRDARSHAWSPQIKNAEPQKCRKGCAAATCAASVRAAAACAAAACAAAACAAAACSAAVRAWCAAAAVRAWCAAAAAVCTAAAAVRAWCAPTDASGRQQGGRSQAQAARVEQGAEESAQGHCVGDDQGVHSYLLYRVG